MSFIQDNKKLFAIIFWIWVATIIFFSVKPHGPKMQITINESIYRLDYLLHFGVYFGLAVLYLLWKANNYFKLKPRLLIYFLIGGLILSGLSEYIQTYIPGRTFNPIDFYSNVSGIVAGIIIPKIVLK